MEGYCITTPKPTRKSIPSLGYFIIKHHDYTHGFTLLEGCCPWPKLLNTFIIPFSTYPKNTLGSITYLLKHEGVFHNLPKPISKAISCLGYSINTMG
jgi:hypothetical protein